MSFSFFTELLGLRPAARWDKGAYLVAGNDWICLSLDAEGGGALSPGYTHLAFSVSVKEFCPMVAQLRKAQVVCWQENHSRETHFTSSIQTAINSKYMFPTFKIA